jgi:hypothetical protein
MPGPQDRGGGGARQWPGPGDRRATPPQGPDAEDDEHREDGELGQAERGLGLGRCERLQRRDLAARSDADRMAGKGRDSSSGVR